MREKGSCVSWFRWPILIFRHKKHIQLMSIEQMAWLQCTKKTNSVTLNLLGKFTTPQTAKPLVINLGPAIHRIETNISTNKRKSLVKTTKMIKWITSTYWHIRIRHAFYYSIRCNNQTVRKLPSNLNDSLFIELASTLLFWNDELRRYFNSGSTDNCNRKRFHFEFPIFVVVSRWRIWAILGYK